MIRHHRSLWLGIIESIFSLGLLLGWCWPGLALAATGTIDHTQRYAWSENTGWIDFGTDNGAVQVTDTGLSGYALSETIGWINLSGVNNDGAGHLSGKAWSENAGWIDFSPANGGVTINSAGQFTGAALGENIGWLNFNTDQPVTTDWRPANSVSATVNQPSGGGGGSGWVSWPGNQPAAPPPTPSPVVSLPSRVFEKIKQVERVLQPLVTGFSSAEPAATVPEVPPPAVPTKPPPVFSGQWRLWPHGRVAGFALAPLPTTLRTLAQKFPSLDQTFRAVGVSRLADVEKLQAAHLLLPGLTAAVGLPTTKIELGKIALPRSVSATALPPAVGALVPTDTVFTQTGGGSIDLRPVLSINDQGEPKQSIQTVAAQTLQLAVKPSGPVDNVKGYVVFKQRSPVVQLLPAPAGYLLAAAFVPLIEKKPLTTVPADSELVLQRFNYADPDGDGVYTTSINAPAAAGEYQIVTVVAYRGKQLAPTELRLTAVVDPEGYVYEQTGNKETRLPGATVSLFWLNQETKRYELWPAGSYQQENPQVTDQSGTYSFLVPEGDYYLTAAVPGYQVYRSESFLVQTGRGVHLNLPLVPERSWRTLIDWKVILLIVVLGFLIYNFYRNRLMERRLTAALNAAAKR